MSLKEFDGLREIEVQTGAAVEESRAERKAEPYRRLPGSQPLPKPVRKRGARQAKLVMKTATEAPVAQTLSASDGGTTEAIIRPTPNVALPRSSKSRSAKGGGDGGRPLDDAHTGVASIPTTDAGDARQRVGQRTTDALHMDADPHIPSVSNDGEQACSRLTPNMPMPAPKTRRSRKVTASDGAPKTIVIQDKSGAVATFSGNAGDGGIDRPDLEARTIYVDPVVVATIQEQWRRRRAWHRAEKSLTLQAKALCRRLAVDGDKKEADIIYNAALGKGRHDHAELALAAMFPLTNARDEIEKHRKAVEKRLAKLAAGLPVAPFVMATRGVGIASLAAIVGEAGDLANYSNPAKLWKRMGLAVMPDGSRQRRVAGDAAVAHGYNPERRSVMWNIGACIIKAGGPLKHLYDERKAFELNGKTDRKSVAHARAQRYVEKRFLRLLWSQWRAATGHIDSANHDPTAVVAHEQGAP